jgi:hypothetical protein
MTASGELPELPPQKREREQQGYRKDIPRGVRPATVLANRLTAGCSRKLSVVSSVKSWQVISWTLTLADRQDLPAATTRQRCVVA